MSRVMDRPWRCWDDLWVADLGLPVPAPPNNATLLRPLGEERLEDVVSRVQSFFTGSSSGGYQLWSVWPTPDLEPFGFGMFQTPCMVRPAGGEPTPAPPRLSIVEVGDASELVEVEAILIEAFDIQGAEPGAIYDGRVLDDDTFRIWLGRVDGRPVSTSAAYLSDGFVGVYAVATTEDERGRGYGEALTWAATLSRPELPATLQSSATGKLVYDRMGYESVAEFAVWEAELG